MYAKGMLERDETTDGRMVVLPHSCDEWEIGDAHAVRDLIEDLQEALPWLEERR